MSDFGNSLINQGEDVSFNPRGDMEKLYDTIKKKLKLTLEY